jgi:hypothetical protein
MSNKQNKPMQDWSAYAQSLNQAQGESGQPRQPSVFEYMFIKVIDNALIISIFVLTLVFSFAGAWLKIKNYDCNQWFFDIAKICFGVLLGNLARKEKHS